jgi:Protein of unknown function (DUF3035)
MRTWSLLLSLAALAPIALSGCSQIKTAIGTQKVVPNEFDVVQNAPLAIPPDFALRPPRPGTAPTQSIPASTEAKETIFRAGDQQGGLPAPAGQRSVGETDLLQAAGAANAAPDIRDVVNQESTGAQPFNTNFVDDLIFWRDPNKKEEQKGLLDPVKEAERLRQKNAGAATVASQFSSPPTIERKSDIEGTGILNRIF